MKGKLMQRFVPANVWAALLLAAASVGLAIAVMYGGIWLTGSQPEYTNKTVSQQWDDLARLRRERVDACNSVGGYWIQGGCTHNYPAPDTSWYVVPERNGWYELTDMGGVAIVVVGIILVFAGPVLVHYAASEKREKIAEQQRSAAYDLSVNPGTP